MGNRLPSPRYARGHTSLLTPNTLQRGFTVQRPNKVWVTNISTKPTMAREPVLDAILMAVRRRKPKHALIHSDQGSQFGSDAWRRFCHDHYLEASMSRRRNCCDNAVAESCFSSMK